MLFEALSESAERGELILLTGANLAAFRLSLENIKAAWGGSPGRRSCA